MTTSKKAAGERIHTIRKSKKMSLEALGEHLGVGKSSVHGYENGDNWPSHESLIKIAELGETTVDWILTGKEPEPISTLQNAPKDELTKDLSQKVLPISSMRKPTPAELEEAKNAVSGIQEEKEKYAINGTLDFELLAEASAAIKNAEIHSQIHVKPEKLWTLIKMLYDDYAKGIQVEPARIIEMVRLAA